MGEVYRGRDTKLGREVAIKVLPDSLASDPDRLARFSREAQVLAALNHPNIAHIHGFEESTGVPALVMELVEGPTLADRIARGPIPIDEALPIAKQIAEALEAAQRDARKRAVCHGQGRCDRPAEQIQSSARRDEAEIPFVPGVRSDPVHVRRGMVSYGQGRPRAVRGPYSPYSGGFTLFCGQVSV